ncbi:hypothetical protein niasHT_024919 [Heterodera trifolii]|uniref:Transmembrane protein n=1 Tax=Heterodera trifolii TaxID=157864 RepID=A0ABD2KNS2_9BILA
MLLIQQHYDLVVDGGSPLFALSANPGLRVIIQITIGKTETTCPTETTSTASSTIICPPPPPTTTHSILLLFITVLILFVFFAQVVQVGALLRRMVKNRIIQRKLQKRQKRMKTLRSQAGRQSMPMVVNFGRTGDGQMFGQVGGRQSSMSPPVVPVNLGGVPPYQGLQTQQREVIYDVPADGGGHEHAEDDEDDDSF